MAKELERCQVMFTPHGPDRRQWALVEPLISAFETEKSRDPQPDGQAPGETAVKELEM